MRREGFSLIELLIVVAIIAALVGVAVPFFQDNLQQAQQTKAQQDLDTIRNALSLHDAQNRPLTGTSLKPLLGRYLQELPKDPWGNDYAVDANVGVLVSFGADGQAGGDGGDRDWKVDYKPNLKIQRCQYIGPWGKPTNQNKMIFTMTKPYIWQGGITGTAAASLVSYKGSLNLLTNIRDRTDGGPVAFGAPVTGNPATTHLEDANNSHTYSFDAVASIGGLLDPVNGVICLKQTGTLVPSNTQAVTPTMAVNFYDFITPLNTYQKYGLEERWLGGGPLDTTVYGNKALITYRRAPYPIQPFEEKDSAGTTLFRNRGVKIERF